MSKFGEVNYDLGICQLRHPTHDDAKLLSVELAKIEPWKTLGSTPQEFEEGFQSQNTSTNTYAVVVNENPVGIISVRYPWLLGPYLGFLGFIPEAQGKGLGKAVMNWLEETAKKHLARNIFICVSDFNHDAQAFYKACGYSKAADLDGLIVDEHSEFLLRKRLS
jgi:ribosomal protein S18 acetylase RimI-like enzyme